MTDPTTALIARLEARGFDPRSTGPDSWESRCPAHDGSRHNLSIKRGEDGRALVYCHHEPGCPPEAIAQALGLTLADLFPADPSRDQPSKNGRAKKPKKVYPDLPTAADVLRYPLQASKSTWWEYPAGDGSPCMGVIRFDLLNGDKTYRPLHVTPEGWVVGDPPGLLPLYQLTKLAGAVRVYVGEGEKVAGRVDWLGLTGTTPAHGAKSPHKTDWSPLAGREVIILSDHDTPGESYAAAVVRLLAALKPRPRVKIVRLAALWQTDAPIPEGGDIEEWLKDGVPEGWGPEQCRAELERLADEAPMEDLNAAVAPPPRETVAPQDGTWPPGTRVHAADQDNYGTVIVDLGAKVKVHFDGTRTGRGKADVALDKSLLTPIDLVTGDSGKGKNPVEPVIIPLSEVEPKELEWLWRDRFPLGGLSIVAGDPGLGKSFLTLDMAARVSTGEPWPDDPSEPNTIGSVVILSAEDDLAATVVPRLIAAGADLKRIVAVETVKTPEGKHRPVTLEDLAALETAIGKVEGCRLIIIDPVTAYMGRVDDHRNAEVRALLAPLGDLASRYGIAVVLVSHLNKAPGGRAVARVMGSLAYVGAARAAWAVAKAKDDPTRRLLLPIKANLAPEPTGLAYALDGDPPRVLWEPDPIDLHADEALEETGRRRGGNGDSPEMAKAREFLREFVKPHPVRAIDAYRRAKDEGISEATLKRARYKEGIDSYQITGDRGWWWRYLEGQEIRGSEDQKLKLVSEE